MENHICFVVTGYGIKTDFRTGRKLNLDKTYEKLIKPVFDELKITCIRSCDIPHSGVIDVPMYENILKADIVVADISTLNANAIYELGVRHALRPNTTIVIAEKELFLANPFDLNHIAISAYEHMGDDISSQEVESFTRRLKTLVEAVVANPATDSPVYTFLHELTPPAFSEDEKKNLQQQASLPGDSIHGLLKEAEALKSAKKYEEALAILRQARERDSNNPYITQRIALLIYKSGLPAPVESLNLALKELKTLQPDITNDPETLGLCGAIYKRLHEQTGQQSYLEKSLSFYERGFLIAKDYYNGINLAYLLLLRASLAVTAEDKIADTVNAKRVRAKTEKICGVLMDSDDFTEMPDKNWILLTRAEIAFTEGNTALEESYVSAALAQGLSSFEQSSYLDQKNRIVALLEKTK
jgi:tetratricopeptide (TPR) repeat protein